MSSRYLKPTNKIIGCKSCGLDFDNDPIFTPSEPKLQKQEKVRIVSLKNKHPGNKRGSVNTLF